MSDPREERYGEDEIEGLKKKGTWRAFFELLFAIGHMLSQLVKQGDDRPGPPNPPPNP